ncbi:hypothetical protein FGO68_gene12027 [Halteria grandinella]|uniref:Uncharacterized protein n=1 Tax=Halteria grandinella TaxID=5974 RepID=A0A8J8SY69_HALGN|nr:hypothetical protein FGO68_gene12027 [Halteria grandinella]
MRDSFGQITMLKSLGLVASLIRWRESLGIKSWHTSKSTSEDLHIVFVVNKSVKTLKLSKSETCLNAMTQNYSY